MTGRMRASSRVVFALAVLLVAPAGARAQTARPAVAIVAPLAHMGTTELGAPPLSVTISRIIFTPGSGDEAEILSGPRLVLIESGSLVFHATGNVRVTHAATEPGFESTATATSTPTPVPTPTPTPARSPTTDVILNRGDAVPVPIWTMHSFHNDGPEPAVILDVRITSSDRVGLPTNLDIETLSEETGLTTLPAGSASITLGKSTVAPGGMVLAPPTETYQLVAVSGGAGQVERAADGSLRNPGATAVDVYVVAIAQSGVAGPRQPAQPMTGPGGAEVAFDRVVGAHFGPEEQGYYLYEPADPHPGTSLATTGPFPVVLFLGGGCSPGSDPCYSELPADVQAWLDHLTQRGTIVIYPIVRADHAQEDMAAAMREAMAELGTGSHVRADWTRFAVFGYSLGGWLAPVYAATAAAEGVPVPQAIFSTVAYDPGTTPDLSAIPASTHVVVLVGDADHLESDRGARRIWAALTTVPADHRAFVRLVSDFHGVPILSADHPVPGTAVYATLNALDWYGTWRLGDALMSCSFAGHDCEYAFGNTPEQRFMGYWSDGVPVAELEVIAEPGPPDPATPTA
jgi:hypothetical protein